MRAVLDPNVIISGLLSPSGSCARLLQAWQRGEFDLIISETLLEELARALAYPKVRRRIPQDAAQAAIDWLSDEAVGVPDPPGGPPVHSADHDDDYLIALAASQQALLVSGDDHLLELADRIPILAPARYLEQLAER